MRASGPAQDVFQRIDRQLEFHRVGAFLQQLAQGGGPGLQFAEQQGRKDVPAVVVNLLGEFKPVGRVLAHFTPGGSKDSKHVGDSF